MRDIAREEWITYSQWDIFPSFDASIESNENTDAHTAPKALSLGKPQAWNTLYLLKPDDYITNRCVL